MVLQFYCEKHDIGYVVADLYPDWWGKVSPPYCPLCFEEWLPDHPEIREYMSEESIASYIAEGYRKESGIRRS